MPKRNNFASILID